MWSSGTPIFCMKNRCLSVRLSARAHKEDITRTEGPEKGPRQVTEANEVDKRPQRSGIEKKGLDGWKGLSLTDAEQELRHNDNP
ncbi:hypothetical protein E2C01_067944 [Portunus trituberculatus]|uniref:Uncharacterized protein n=1 Tax=Portunus trituberculatus TaxID=210409 RepID=A0A5B7HV22_PORTR|nr:hypothetical protein [Portunus trituberculatus]